jgi:hypothetical protein
MCVRGLIERDNCRIPTGVIVSSKPAMPKLEE